MGASYPVGYAGDRRRALLDRKRRLLERLREVFHPIPYDEVPDLAGSPLDLLLLQRRWWGARYALAALEWRPGVPAGTQVSAARQELARRTSALWMLREVGAYLILLGDEASWQGAALEVAADRTGLHHVILQAIHLVDPSSGEAHVAQSQWGPLTFGGVGVVAEVVQHLAREVAEA